MFLHSRIYDDLVKSRCFAKIELQKSIYSNFRSLLHNILTHNFTHGLFTILSFMKRGFWATMAGVILLGILAVIIFN